jgi:hypothetical protein
MNKPVKAVRVTPSCRSVDSRIWLTDCPTQLPKKTSARKARRLHRWQQKVAKSAMVSHKWLWKGKCTSTVQQASVIECGEQSRHESRF